MALFDIEDKEDWWKMLDLNWESLLLLIQSQFDLDVPCFKEPHNEESGVTTVPLKEWLVHLKESKDIIIQQFLHETWYRASENFARQRYPGWIPLCDLLSEFPVLLEELIEKEESKDG